MQVTELLAMRSRYDKDVAGRNGHDIEESQDTRCVQYKEAIGRDGFVIRILRHETARRRIGRSNRAERAWWFWVGHCSHTRNELKEERSQLDKVVFMLILSQISRLCYMHHFRGHVTQFRTLERNAGPDAIPRHTKITCNELRVVGIRTVNLTCKIDDPE